MFRDGLRRLLEREDGFVIEGESSAGQAGVALVTRLQPDILLLGVRAPDDAESRCARRSKRAHVGDRSATGRCAGRSSGVASRCAWNRAQGIGDAGAVKCIRCVDTGEYWVERESVRTRVKKLQTAERRPRGPSG